MRKPLSLLILAAAALSALFSGCLKPPPPSGVTQLQFYLSAWGTDDKVRAQEMINGFQRENPDIRINLVCISPPFYNERMQTLLVGGIVPDVMTVDPGVYYEWADRGMLMDLTGLMRGAAREQKMTFMPIVDEELDFRGHYYAVPYLMCGVILQLNLDMFRRAGVPVPPAEGITWDWVARVAPGFSTLASGPKAPAQFFFILPDMTSMLFTFGARIFDDPKNPHRVLVDSPEAAAMCRYVRKLSATKSVLTRAEVMRSSGAASDAQFIRGLAPAEIHGLWAAPGMYGIPALFHWDVRPFPAGPTGKRVTANGASMLGIPANAAHAAAAARFLRFYLTPRGIAINCRRGEYMPLFREMLHQPGIMPPATFARQYYFDTMEKGMCVFPVYGPGVGELRRIIDNRLGQVSAEPDVPIPVILKTLEDEIYRWLADEKQNGFYR